MTSPVYISSSFGRCYRALFGISCQHSISDTENMNKNYRKICSQFDSFVVHRSPTLREAIDFSITSNFQMASPGWTRTRPYWANLFSLLIYQQPEVQM